MSGNRELQALDISPPMQFDTGDNPGPSGTFSAALSTSSTRYIIPTAWKGNYVSFTFTADVQISFGDDGVSVTRDTDSTVSSEALTAAAGTGYYCYAGVEYHWRIPRHKGITRFALLTSSASGSGRWFARMSNNTLTDDF